MTLDTLHLVEITRLDDDLLLPWLNLYETTFPPNERVMVSYLLGLLKDKARGLDQENTMLAALNGDGTLVGMAMYGVEREADAIFLWYMAIRPDLRNKGWGSRLYQELLRRLDPSIKAVLLEVEIPHETISQRRVQFYRRHGAYLLRGVDYLQYVGEHQPPIPMYIMVHPLHPMDAQEAFERAKIVFQDAINQVGPLALE